MTHKALCVLIPLLTLHTPVSSQSLDPRLANEVDRLLTAYGQFKGYSDTRPHEVEATFTADRKVVFQAGVGAMFTEILPKKWV